MPTSLQNTLARILTNMPTALQQELGQGSELPKRYFVQAPQPSETFILPLKQCFMKDARLMPGTRCMLALLSGWTGTGNNLQLTQSTIARHLGRSVRQVYRYLKDAARLGYLSYNYRKHRGMITGIRIFLSLELLRPKKQKQGKHRRTPVRTSKAENNVNRYLTRKDKEVELRLRRLSKVMGIEYPP